MIVLAAAIVITLSNSGIINKANEAVDTTNLKQVQELAQMIWAEGYLDNKDEEEIKGEIVSKLGDAASKYNIVVTDKGVIVTKLVTIAPGLYKSGTDYKELVKDWNTLVNEGVIQVENGVVYTNIDFENGVNTSSDILVGDLVLPSDGSVTAIGDYVEDEDGSSGNLAFPMCTNLTGIRIPKNVTSICMGAFMECSSLRRIKYEGTTEEWKNVSLGEAWNMGVPALGVICINSVNGSAGLYETGTANLVADWDTLVNAGVINVENGVVYTNIDTENATNLSAEYLIGDLILPDDGSITALGDAVYDIGFSSGGGNAAFWGCTGLTSITIPDSVTSVSDSAFAMCTSLSKVKLSNNITEIGEACFWCCTSLEEIILPDGIENIEYQAFAGCTSLKNISIPNSIERVAANAFENCPQLTYTEYQNGLYLGCESNPYVILINIKDNTVNTFNIQKDTKVINWESVCSNITSLTIPDGVKQISVDGETFPNLTNLSIPDSVINCNIRTDNMPNLSYTEYENGLYLGNSLNPYVVLVGVKDRTVNTFNINNNTKVIGESAFESCKNLTGIVVPDKVIQIGGSAFANCTNLSNVVFNDKIKIIAGHAFNCCSNIESISLPASLNRIGHAAFSSCTKLVTVNFGGSMKQWNNMTVGGVVDCEQNNPKTIICSDGTIIYPEPGT